MKIPVGKLIKRTHSSYRDFTYSDILDSKDFIILCLIILYHVKKISHKQFAIYCQRYFNSGEKLSLYRKIKTYHSVFDDKWYDDVTFLTVIVRGLENVSVPYEMSIEDILKYVNIGFNRNRNWCVNYIASAWIKPIIDNALGGNTLCQELISEFSIKTSYISYEEADRKHDLASGYCCKDCDGCLGEYKRSRYEAWYKPNKKALYNDFRQELVRYKTHTKNPNDWLTNAFA